MRKRKPALHWQIMIGLALGILWAVIAGYTGLAAFTLKWIDPFGIIFINLLKLIAVPLVLFSIISGIAGMGGASSLGKIGLKTLAWYLCTTVLAITIGLTIVNLIQPGNLIDRETRLRGAGHAHHRIRIGGLNPAWIAIIFPVDRILDMCRTVANISGDAAVSSIIAHSEKMLYFDKKKIL